MAIDLTSYWADKRARLARGEKKLMTAVAAIVGPFEAKVEELVHSLEGGAATSAAPPAPPPIAPEPATWTRVDTTQVQG